jgi:hypothetical protein
VKRLPALISRAPFHQQESLRSGAGEKPCHQTEKEMAHEEKTGDNQPEVFRDLAVKDKIAAPTASQHPAAAVPEFVFACLVGGPSLCLQDPESLKSESLEPESLKAWARHPQNGGL